MPAYCARQLLNHRHTRLSQAAIQQMALHLSVGWMTARQQAGRAKQCQPREESKQVSESNIMDLNHEGSMHKTTCKTALEHSNQWGKGMLVA